MYPNPWFAPSPYPQPPVYGPPPLASEHEIKKTIKHLKSFLREAKAEKAKKSKPPPKVTFTAGEMLGILMLAGPIVGCIQYFGLVYLFTQISLSLHNISNGIPH